MKVIVGLGNPGKKYEATRHNVGFIAIDELAYRHGIKVNKVKFKSLIGEGRIEMEKVLLVKPQTFMNDSGIAVREIVDFYRVDMDDLVVLYDDIDIDAGKLRIREKGSAGTHNGMRSIIYHLQKQDFPRIRIGVSKPQNLAYDLADWVLGKFPKEQHPIMLESIKRAADSVEEIVKDTVVNAMNKYNG